MKEKTALLLQAAKERRHKSPKRLALDSVAHTPEGRKYLRQLKKTRKALADRIRGIRQFDGPHIARCFARVP